MTKIAYWDLETAMMEVGLFQLKRNDYINPDNITKESFIIMGSYADISDVKTQSDIKKLKVHNISVIDKLWRFKKDMTDDYYVVKKIRDELEKFDVIVAHNGDRFDVKKLNARIMYHKLKPLPPILTVDTLKEVRKVASFASHKLSYLLEHLGLEQQKGSASGAWLKLLKGSYKEKIKAVKSMGAYCDQDIRGGVALYIAILPYMKSHPNIADDNTNNCPKCNSSNIQKRGTRRLKSGTLKQDYSCNDCRSWFRLRKSEKEKPLSTL